MLLKISKIIFISLVFIFIFGIFSVKIDSPDFWWHLKTGEYIYQTGSLPETDPFAFTSIPKDPIHPESGRIKFILTQYWLAQVIFYCIYSSFGFQGIISLRALILTLLIFLIYKSIRREGLGTYLSIGLLIPAIIVFHAFTGERPQLFSFLFAFLLIYLLEGFRISSLASQTRRLKPAATTQDDRYELPGSPLKSAATLYLLPLPLIMLIWANLHGGFILGVVIILGYIFSEMVKHATKRLGHPLPLRALKLITAIGLVSIACSLINPNGYNVISILIELGQSKYKDMITEMMSPFLQMRLGFYTPELFMFLILLLLVLLSFLLNIRMLNLTDLLIFIGLTSMSLSSARYIPFFTPVSILMIARYGLMTLEKTTLREKFYNLKSKAAVFLPIIFSIGLIFVLAKGDLFKSGIESNKYPEGAAQFLKDNRIYGNMFNPYPWGGYLIWSLCPDYKVFIDGRGLIEEVFFQEKRILEASTLNFEGIPEWKGLLRAYGVDFILTYSVHNFTGRLVPLIPAMLYDPEWHLIYMDNISLIFLRESPENMEVIRKFGMLKEWLWNEVAVEAALKSKGYKRTVQFYVTMGDAFFAKRSYRDAKEAYERAMKIDPESSVVKQRLELLRSYGY